MRSGRAGLILWTFLILLLLVSSVHATPDGVLNYTNVSNSFINLSTGGGWDSTIDGAEFDFWMEKNGGSCSVQGYMHKAWCGGSCSPQRLVYINGTNVTEIKFRANTSLTTVRTLGMARSDNGSPYINGTIHVFVADYGSGSGEPLYHYTTTPGSKTNFVNACGSSSVLGGGWYNSAITYDSITGNWTLAAELPGSGGTKLYTSVDGCNFDLAGTVANAVSSPAANGTDPWMRLDYDIVGNPKWAYYSVDWVNAGATGDIVYRTGSDLIIPNMAIANPSVVPASLGWGVATAGPAVLIVPNECLDQSPFQFYLFGLADGPTGPAYGSPFILRDADNRSYFSAHNATTFSGSGNGTGLLSESYDTFYPGSGCTGSAFDCGTNTDKIVDIAGTFRVNITYDDNATTFYCAVFISGPNATAKTCIIRNGFTTTACDGISTVQLGNHSDYYVCPSADMSTCGWGTGAIPAFGSSTPTRSFQINTAQNDTSEVIFTSYFCTDPGATVQTIARYYRVVNQKGVVCSGDDYQPSVFDRTGTVALSTPVSCSSGSFCDPTTLANFSTSSTMTGAFCTPGCADSIQNSQETDVDYGGAVCGNCSTQGKGNDEFYVFAKELQTSDLGPLRPTSPFNATLYCEDGQTIGSASIGVFFVFFFISVVSILVLLGAILGLSLFILVPVGRFLRSKYKKRKQGT